MKKLLCATLDGLSSIFIEVEASFVRSLPGFEIIGEIRNSVKEGSSRVKTALNFINFKFPPQKLVVNLSPSDIKKEGTHFDLPIALLIALYKEEINFSSYVAFGELGLDGKIKDTNSIFPIILDLANELKEKTILIPKDSYEKISKIPDINILTADTLQEAIDILKEKKEPMKTKALLDANSLMTDKTYYYTESFDDDFKDIKGQQRAIRASLIAASGFHNIMFEGSPGCGKSMCVKRLQHILPPMSLEEILQKAKLDALINKEVDFIPKRSFRSPHHTASQASIFGGANKSIGEVALCGVYGLLYFDELPYFAKSVLEALREPLQDHKILISRVKDKIEYPTKFLFATAQNPCPCGNLFSKTKECRCSEIEIKRYKNRLSSPLLDRIDIYVQMEEIDLDDKPITSSKEMFEKVLTAFKMQKQRQSEFNGKLSDKEIEKHCKLDDESKTILNNAIIRFELSQRAINNIKKVSRTIADLDESKNIEKKHLLEAISYRMKS